MRNLQVVTILVVTSFPMLAMSQNATSRIHGDWSLDGCGDIDNIESRRALQRALSRSFLTFIPNGNLLLKLRPGDQQIAMSRKATWRTLAERPKNTLRLQIVSERRKKIITVRFKDSDSIVISGLESPLDLIYKRIKNK